MAATSNQTNGGNEGSTGVRMQIIPSNERMMNINGENYERVERISPEKYLTAVYETSRAKSVNEQCKYGLGKIREVVPLKTLLITCNLTPEYTYEDSWRVMIREREKITNELFKRYEDIQFAVTAIEHHHTISKKMLGREKEMDIRAVEAGGNVIIPKKQLGIREVSNVEGEQEQEVEGAKEGSLYEVYTSETMEKFGERISRWKESQKIMKDMTGSEMTVTYYNFLQTMHYLNGEAKREEGFREWIAQSQRAMAGYMNSNQTPVYDERQRAIISHHKEVGNNLLGYPHIHIAIGYANIVNVEKFVKEIYDYLMEIKIFPDPDVAVTKTKEAEMEGKAITYVLKNHANMYVHNQIREYGGGEEEICKFYINSTGNEEMYKEFAKGFVEKRDRKYFRRISMEIIRRVKEIPNVIKEEKRVVTIDPEKNNYNRLLSYILEVMRESNLVICTGEIYIKEQGTKMTYRQYMDIESFVTNITAVEPYNTIGHKWNGSIIKIMKEQDEEKIAEISLGSAESNYRIRFPRIKMDYRMIEFKDFYFNTITAKIYKEQNKYYCHYYSGVTMENLEVKLGRFEQTSEWMKILRNSRINNRIIYGLLFTLLRPKGFKSPIPMVYGDSNAGKTTLIEPFKNYYPKNKVSTLSKAPSEYHIYDMVQEKELTILEEGNAILNDIRARSQTLILLEGTSDVTANKKHGEIKNIPLRVNIAVMCNLSEEDIYMDDNAMLNRIYPIGKMRELPDASNKKDILRREEAYIYLFTGLNFMRIGKEDPNNNDFFEIVNEMTEEDKLEIETYKKQSEGIIEDKYVDIYSDEYIRTSNETRTDVKETRRQLIYNYMRTGAIDTLLEESNKIRKVEMTEQIKQHEREAFKEAESIAMTVEEMTSGVKGK